MQTTRPPADLEAPGCWLWRSCQVNRVRHEGRGGQSGGVSGFRVNYVGKRDSGSDVGKPLKPFGFSPFKKKT